MEDLTTRRKVLESPVFSAIEQGIADLRNGRFVIVFDDYNRENEGDLIMLAELATAEHIAFMIRHTSGIICVAASSDRLAQLALPPMVVRNEDPKGTAFTVSVDYRHGTTTGISAHDRALTIRKLADHTVSATDFHRPGHVFPLRYHAGGVLVRRGHTEAAVDLAHLTGCTAVGCLAELMNDDGTVARFPDLLIFAKQYNLCLLTIADLARYRMDHLTEVEY